MGKDNKEKADKKNDFEKVDKEIFAEESNLTQLVLSKTRDGKSSGITMTTGKKHTNGYIKWHKTAWLPSDLNAPNWLNKLKWTLHKLFSKWYGKEIISEKDIELQSIRIEELEKQVYEEKKKREDMEKNLLDLELKKELAKEIKSKRKDYEEKLNVFENKIQQAIKDNTNIEEDIKRDLEENRWILGLDCEVRAKNKKIDNQAGVDLHIINTFGQNRIIEAKSPNKKLFKKRTEEGRLLITPELSEALSELICYMNKTDVYSELSMSGTQKISKPSGIVLMDGNLDKEEGRFLDILNSHFRPHITVVTYNQLIDNAKKEVSLLD